MTPNTDALPPLPADPVREALQRIIDWDAAGMALTEDHIAQARASLAAQQGAQVPQGADAESRAMFVARLENMQENGDHWLTVASVLALLNDCDYLASRSASPQAQAEQAQRPALVTALRGLLASLSRAPTEFELRAAAHEFTVMADRAAAADRAGADSDA